VKQAIQFLHATGQALSAIGLYSPAHPAVVAALDKCYESLGALLEVSRRQTFHFLGNSAPIFDNRVIHEMATWPWAANLSTIGVQRVELESPVSREIFEEFLTQVFQRLTEHDDGVVPVELVELQGIRFGTVTVVDPFEKEEAEDVATVEEDEEEEDSREATLDLTDELAAMAEVITRASRGSLAFAEADTIARVLEGHLSRHELPQAVAPVEPTAYPQFHAVNTALLAMAVANSAGIVRSDRHRLGVAALLHDIGMALLPNELLFAASLSDDLRRIMETHTELGARMILDQGGPTLDLAAIVAHEHHLRPDGGGYPQRRFVATSHWASRLVGTCATYVALRAPRPYRAPWSPSRVLNHLAEGAGVLFDVESSRSVAHLVSSR
jgi:HD-GYP domain-containing protein (c-di-GMP phosphodiesterase class II)